MNRSCRRQEANKKCIQNFSRRNWRIFGNPSYNWEDDTKMDL